MSKLSKDIIGKIKKEKLMPKSRWYFLALHTGIWAAVIVTIVFGALGIAIAIRHLTLTDWELANQISSNPLNFMPVLWFGIIALAIFSADQIFKRTKKGYKFKISHVVVASILLSITLGGGFFFVEADQGFESAIRENIKPYQTWENKRAAKFVMPHRGVLAGEITQIDEKWMVVDFRGQEWKVDITSAQISPNLEPAVGEKVGMKGEKLSEEEFKAHHIRAFEDAREQFRKKKQRLESVKKESPRFRSTRGKMEYERKR